MTLEVYTSYYSNIRNIPRDIALVGISRGVPAGVNCYRYEPLYPSSSLLQWYKSTSSPSWIEYTNRYREETLELINKYQVLTELVKLTGSYKFALLCYEGKSKECHRHLAASWLPVDVKEI